MKNDPSAAVHMFVPKTARELIEELEKCQSDEYLFRSADGNLVSSFGRVVNIGHQPLVPP